MDVHDAARAHVGETVADKYQLLRLLGAGGMGAVYEAEHVFTKRRVALKRMHPGIAKSRIAAERFVRESQAPSSIGHPGIVQVLDGGFENDGSLYLVLELLEGVSMSDALEEKALEPAGVVQIGIELLDALAAAHEKGFIHRDIKPDNIFLAHDGRDGIVVKLLDFGIASVQATEGDVKLTQTGAVLGTPLYMSPEQAKGHQVDARSDLWSVGAMLYRALAGTSPYNGESYNALIVSIVTQEHIPLDAACKGLPKQLSSVVEHALQKSCERRYQTAKQMADDLRAVRFGVEEEEEEEEAEAHARQVPSLPPYASLRPAKHEAKIAPVPPSLMEEAVRERARSTAGIPKLLPAYEEPTSPWLGRLALVIGVSLLVLVAYFALRPKPEPTHASVVEEPQLPSAPTTTPSAAGVIATPAVEPNAPTTQAAQPATGAEVVIPEAAAAPTKPTAERDDGLPPEALGTMLAEHQAQMQHCLEEAVVTQMIAGTAKPGPIRLDIEFAVAASGSVESVDVRGQAPSGLDACVRNELRKAVFPRAGAATVFRYPLVFQPQIVGK